MNRCILALVGVGAVSATASADLYVWDWDANVDGTSGLNMNAGEFSSIHAEYDTVTERFLWDVTFADQITDGYTLAVNDGPNPKGHAGELGLIYFDATGDDARVTVYAYNGVNSMNSYKDGSPASGTQTPDMILAASMVDATMLNHSSIIEASVIDGIDGSRRMTLEMDASIVNAHAPEYPGPDGIEEWTGVQFAELLGLWMHPVKNLVTEYNEDGTLANWRGSQGWFDGSGFETTPTPGSALLLSMGVVAATRRRRA